MNLYIVVISEEIRKILVVPHYWIKDLHEPEYFIGGVKRYFKHILHCFKEYPSKAIDGFDIPAELEDTDFSVYILKAFGKKHKNIISNNIRTCVHFLNLYFSSHQK